MNGRSLLRWMLLGVIATSTVGCDQVTKHLARAELAAHGGSSLLGGIVRFTLAHNTGGFLSLGAALPAPLRAALFIIGAGVGLLLIGLYIARGPALSVLSLVGGTLFCGGGIGNLLDRMLDNGRVTDFIIVTLGPVHTGVFNVADLAIVFGSLLFIAARGRRTSSG